MESLGRKAEPLSTPKKSELIRVLAVGMSLDQFVGRPARRQDKQAAGFTAALSAIRLYGVGSFGRAAQRLTTPKKLLNDPYPCRRHTLGSFVSFNVHIEKRDDKSRESNLWRISRRNRR